MKTIPLTQGYEAIVDDEDYDLLSRHKWCAHKSRYSVYAKTRIGRNNNVLMHLMILGTGSPSEMIDHANRNGLDNRRCNLRRCTRSQNLFNSKRRSDNSTGVKGVRMLENGNFRARIGVNGNRLFLGDFKTLEEAGLAYRVAALRYAGSFSRFN